MPPDVRHPTKPRSVRGFVIAGRSFAAFKWTVYALLAANVVLYGLHGTPNEQVDTGAWVVLLLLFEWETGGWWLGARTRLLVHALRLLASLAVVSACASYAMQREWLDFANALAWLGVVIALELEVRVPPRRRRFHAARRALTLGLYAALAAFLAAWLAIGLAERDAAAWLDAWDAALWLLAFAVIELNVFGWGRDRDARS